MAERGSTYVALVGGLLFALLPGAAGTDDNFRGDPAPAIAVAVPLPPGAGAPVVAEGSPPAALDPVLTASLPPAPPRPILEPAAPPSAFAEALRAYGAGDLAGGDRASRLIEPGLYATSAEWAALRSLPRESGFARIQRFVAAHPGWPAADWLQKRAEEALYGDRHSPEFVRAALALRPPHSPAGRIALARLRLADGDVAGAAALISKIWREKEFNREIEATIRSEFGQLLTSADHKFRADRLLYKDNAANAMRFAELAGPDVVLLARARAAVVNEAASDAAFAAVPKALQDDPGLVFSRIQKLRRAEKSVEAAQLMLKAPRDPAVLVDGDEWWVERRLLARDMLDRGEAQMAYTLCAQHGAQGEEARIEAEFHAGWIALRFLHDPARALPHFAAIGEIAKTPMSQARGYYWQGRAFEAQTLAMEAEAAYARAAMHSATFYGQLARQKLGLAEMPVRSLAAATQDEARALPVQVAEALQNAGAKEIAAALMLDAARSLAESGDMLALAQVAMKARDPRLSLNLGKAATAHGFPLDEAAFPTFGVPEFQPLAGSVDRALVYAIVRQESAFAPQASSGAGAKGLMQMLVGTARKTAVRAGVGFDAGRLISDPAFNAQLGAAHLGTLFQEHGGSPVLAFAAYNAGGGRVKQWLAAHGDPRDPDVDAVDWIELIPISETRNYVQRVLENLQVYRARFGTQTALQLESDLKARAMPAPARPSPPAPTRQAARGP